MGSITIENESIELLKGKRYKVIYRETTFDDPPDEDGNTPEPILVELSRVEIKSDKEKIVDLEAKNVILEAAKLDFETRIAELEAK